MATDDAVRAPKFGRAVFELGFALEKLPPAEAERIREKLRNDAKESPEVQAALQRAQAVRADEVKRLAEEVQRRLPTPHELGRLLPNPTLPYEVMRELEDAPTLPEIVEDAVVRALTARVDPVPPSASDDEDFQRWQKFKENCAAAGAKPTVPNFFEAHPDVRNRWGGNADEFRKLLNRKSVRKSRDRSA